MRAVCVYVHSNGANEHTIRLSVTDYHSKCLFELHLLVRLLNKYLFLIDH